MNKRLRKNIRLLGMIVCISLFTGCSNKKTDIASQMQQETLTVEENQSNKENTIGESLIAQVVNYEEDDYYTSWENTVTATIELKEDQISFEGNGVKVEESTLTIEKAGTYVISGTLADGSIIVDAADKAAVRLVLNGVDINCTTTAPVYVKQAGKVVLSLEEGTTNRFTDGESYILEDASSDEPNATIFSKDDLTINGKGSLEVIANYNNAITSKDTLKLMEGTLQIEAVDDGIMGKDAVIVKTGNVQITAKGDGIKATNDTDETKGFVAIEDGNFNIVAGADGIQAKTNVYIAEGTYTVETGGGSANAVKKQEQNQVAGPMGKGQTKVSTTATQVEDTTATTTTENTDESTSYKGIKGSKAIYISGGTFTLDTADDSIHSNDTIAISGGDMTLTSGDDGINADTQLNIGEVKLTITKSYEGLESSEINITSGEINVMASDDGVNISGGNDASAINGRPGQNSFANTEDGKLTISGGTLFVDASGDGLDANGSIEMSGGTVVVNGPTNDGNGALDYDGSFNITGGVFIAAGSAGMAQVPSSSSTQPSIAMTYSANKEAGEMIHLADSNGNALLTFAPTKAYRSVVISIPEIKTGESYSFYAGGSVAGNATNGLYETTAAYTPEGEAVSFTPTDIVTYLSESGVTTGNSGFGPGGNGGGGRGEKPDKGAATQDGTTPPAIPDESNRPALPEGTMPSEGTMKQGGEGMTPPEMPTGDNTTEGMAPPEKPTGEKGANGTPPEKPSTEGIVDTTTAPSENSSAQ